MQERLATLVFKSTRWKGGQSRLFFVGTTMVLALVMLWLGLTTRRIGVNDKLLHFIFFGLLTLSWYLIWDKTGSNNGIGTRNLRTGHPLKVWLESHQWEVSTVVLFALGSIFSEFFQTFVARNRPFDQGDIWANWFGTAVGFSVGVWCRRRWERREEFRRLYRVERGRMDEDEEEMEGIEERDIGSAWYGGEEDETRILFEED